MDSFNSKQKEESIIPISESFNINQDQEDIFESSFQDSFSDNMQYLRILCAIPLTLFEFNEDKSKKTIKL